MTTAHRRRIKNLLKKGMLSGFELAKINLYHRFEYKKASEPELYDLDCGDLGKNVKNAVILTPEEIHALLDKNLTGNRDKVEEYNNWIAGYHSFISILDSAHVLYLKIESLLWLSQVLMERYLTEAAVRFDLVFNRPDIITEKQYQELKAKQRQELFKEKNTLGWILYWRAEQIADRNFGDGSMEILLDKYPGRAGDSYHVACSEIKSLIKDGRLSVTYQKNVLSLLDKMLTEKPDKDILAFIDLAISAEPERKPEKPEPLLEKSTATGEALYNAGLSEWIRYIDEYNHNSGGGAPSDVAVIQNPPPDKIDDRGHYKKPRSLADYPKFGNPDTYIWKMLKQTPRTTFTAILLKVKYKTALFLFKRNLAKILTDVTGINFSEQTNKWYEDIKSALNSYGGTLERAITVSNRARKSLSGILDTIDLDELQIKPELEDKFRKRLFDPLAEDWDSPILKWSNRCHIYFNEEMMERSKNGTFEHSVTLNENEIEKENKIKYSETGRAQRNEWRYG